MKIELQVERLLPLLYQRNGNYFPGLFSLSHVATGRPSFIIPFHLSPSPVHPTRFFSVSSLASLLFLSCCYRTTTTTTCQTTNHDTYNFCCAYENEEKNIIFLLPIKMTRHGKTHTADTVTGQKASAKSPPTISPLDMLKRLLQICR